MPVLSDRARNGGPAASRFRWFPAKDADGSTPKANAGDLLRLIAGGTFNYGLGQTLPLLIGFLLIPLYTAVLTPVDYGIVEICATLTALLSVFMRFGVPGAVSRFYYDHPEGAELNDYVTSVAWFLRTNAVVVGAVAIGAGYFFVRAFVPELPFFPYVPLAVAAAMLATNSDLQRRLIQVRRQSSYSAKLSVANSLLAILLTLVFVLGFRWGALGMLTAQVLTSAAFLVNATLYLAPDLKGQLRMDVVRKSVAYGSGIFASHLMAGMGPFVTRTILAGAASVSAVGLFALASRVMSPLAIGSTAFTSAYMPEYFAARKNGSAASLRALARVESSIWTLGVQGSLAAALLGPPCLLLLTPERFHGAAPLVPILAIGFLGQMLYALMSPEMFYLKTRWMPPLVTTCSMTTTIVLSAVLVGPYAAHGVAVATITGAIVQGLLCGFLAARHAPVPHEWGSLARVSAVGVLTMILVSLLTPRSPVESLILSAGLLALNALVLLATGDSVMRRILLEIQARLPIGAEAAK